MMSSPRDLMPGPHQAPQEIAVSPTLPYTPPSPSEPRPAEKAPATPAVEDEAAAPGNWIDGTDTESLEALAEAHDGMPSDFAETWFAGSLAKDNKA